MPKLQEKPPALKREHPLLKNMKILDFFLFLWVIFALLDPDPDPATQINADPWGSGSETLMTTYDIWQQRIYENIRLVYVLHADQKVYIRFMTTSYGKQNLRATLEHVDRMDPFLGSRIRMRENNWISDPKSY
jgi:hypothetical protein